MVPLVIICSVLIAGQFASAGPITKNSTKEAPNAFLTTLSKSCNISQLLLKQKELLENCKDSKDPNPSLNNTQDVLCWLYSHPLKAYCISKPKDLQLPTLVEVQNKNYGIDAVCGSIVNHTQPLIHIKRMQCNQLCSDTEHDVYRPECLLSYYYFSLLKPPMVPQIQGAAADTVQKPQQPAVIEPEKIPDKKRVDGSAPGAQTNLKDADKLEKERKESKENSPQSEEKKDLPLAGEVKKDLPLGEVKKEDLPPGEVKKEDPPLDKVNKEDLPLGEGQKLDSPQSELEKKPNVPLPSGKHEEHVSGSDPGKEADSSRPETPSKSGGTPPKDSILKKTPPEETQPNPQQSSNVLEQQNQEEDTKVQKVEIQEKTVQEEPGTQNLDVPPKAGPEQKPDEGKPNVEDEEDEQHANDYIQTEDVENNPGNALEQPKQDEHKTVEKKKPDTLGEDPINSDNIAEIDDESYFMSYFMVICVLVVLGYVGYHNRIKVMALVLEGKRGKRQHRSRRPNSANYHKLDSNLEEAISSNVTKNSNNVIY